MLTNYTTSEWQLMTGITVVVMASFRCLSREMYGIYIMVWCTVEIGTLLVLVTSK